MLVGKQFLVRIILIARLRQPIALGERNAKVCSVRIQSGALRGEELAQLLLSVPFRDRDAWTDELLGLEGLPPDVPDLPPGSVPYLPCGVDEIVAFLGESMTLTTGTLRPVPEIFMPDGAGRVAVLTRISGTRPDGRSFDDTQILLFTLTDGLVDTVDQERVAFIQKYFHVEWPDRAVYHSMINTAMGDAAVVHTILDLITTVGATV